LSPSWALGIGCRGRPRAAKPIIDANSLITNDKCLSLCDFVNSPEAHSDVRASTIRITIRMRGC
jgi:hypothetical protein